jgi:hypothetical protein
MAKTGLGINLGENRWIKYPQLQTHLTLRQEGLPTASRPRKPQQRLERLSHNKLARYIKGETV